MFYPSIVPQNVYTGPFGLCKNHITRQDMWCTVFRNTRTFMMSTDFLIHSMCGLFFIMLFILYQKMKRRELRKECRFISFDNFLEYALEKRLGFPTSLDTKAEEVVDFTNVSIEDCMLRFSKESNQKVDLSVNFGQLNTSKLLAILLLRILALTNTVIGEYVLHLDIPGEKPETSTVVDTPKKSNSYEHLQQETTNCKSYFIRDSVSTYGDDFDQKESCTEFRDKSSKTNSNVFISEQNVAHDSSPFEEIERSFYEVQDDIVEYDHALETSEIEARTQWFNNQISKIKENLVENPVETNVIEKPLKPAQHNKRIVFPSRSNRAEVLRRMACKEAPAENTENVKESQPIKGMRVHSLNPKYYNVKYEIERRKTLLRIAKYKRTSKNNNNESSNKQVTKKFRALETPSENIDNKPQKPMFKKPFVRYRTGHIRMKNLSVVKDAIESDGLCTLPKICKKVQDTTKKKYKELKNKDTEIPKLTEYEETTKTELELSSDLKKIWQNSEHMPVSSIRMRQPFMKSVSGGRTAFVDETLPKVSIELPETENKFSKTRRSSFILVSKKSQLSMKLSNHSQRIEHQSIKKRHSCSNLITNTRIKKDSVSGGKEILPKPEIAKETAVEEFLKPTSSSCVLDTQKPEQKFRFQSFSNTLIGGMKKESPLPKVFAKYNKSHSTIELEKNNLKSAMEMKNEPLLRSQSNIERSYKQSLLFTMTDKQRARNEMQEKFMPPKKVVKVLNKLVPTNLIDNEVKELPTTSNKACHLKESPQLEEDDKFSTFIINNNIDNLTRKNKTIEKIIQAKQTDPECETKPTNVENFKGGPINYNEEDLPSVNIDIYSRPPAGNDILDTNTIQKKAN